MSIPWTTKGQWLPPYCFIDNVNITHHIAVRGCPENVGKGNMRHIFWKQQTFSGKLTECNFVNQQFFFSRRSKNRIFGSKGMWNDGIEVWNTSDCLDSWGHSWCSSCIQIWRLDLVDSSWRYTTATIPQACELLTNSRLNYVFICN